MSNLDEKDTLLIYTLVEPDMNERTRTHLSQLMKHNYNDALKDEVEEQIAHIIGSRLRELSFIKRVKANILMNFWSKAKAVEYIYAQ